MIELATDSDKKPWYRHFWPWFLMILPASVVVAGLSTAFIAARHADDLVVDDYYKNGLAINRQLERKQQATARGISAQLQFFDDTVRVQILGPVDDQNLNLRLSHPFETDRDFMVALTRIAPGRYRGILTNNISDHWHWIIEEQNEEQSKEESEDGWRLDGVIQASEIGDARSD
jgi:hypothetical protein